MREYFDVPDAATTIRLVRPVGDDLREYEAMECDTGARGIRRLLRQSLVRPGEYGMADLLNAESIIIGEVELDKPSFQLVKRRLRCRAIREEPPAFMPEPMMARDIGADHAA